MSAHALAELVHMAERGEAVFEAQAGDWEVDWEVTGK